MPQIVKQTRPSTALLQRSPVVIIWEDGIIATTEDGTQVVYDAIFRRLRPFEVVSLDTEAEELHESINGEILIGDPPELIPIAIDLCKYVVEFKRTIVLKKALPDGSFLVFDPYTNDDWFRFLLNDQTLRQLAVIRRYIYGAPTPKELKEREAAEAAEAARKKAEEDGGPHSGNDVPEGSDPTTTL